MSMNKASQVINTWLERDLTRASNDGELPRAFEVEHIVDRVRDVLSAGRHAIITGDTGVGKTALVNEIARRQANILNGRLAGKQIYQFSLQRRIAALKQPDQLRPELQKLFDALLASGQEIVPFFRDLHVAQAVGVGPLFQSFALRWGGVVLCEGQRRQIDALIEDNPELDQHYMVVHIEEPDVQRMPVILNAWSANEHGARGVSFTSGALHAALHLTNRFLSRSHQPRAAIELLDQAKALAQPGESVDERLILDRFCASYRVPRELVDPADPWDAAAVRQAFEDRILGQPQAVEAVVNIMTMIKAGLSDLRRPFGAYLFVGPTGVGKTHIAQLLAAYLFGRPDRMLRFNMADFQKDDSADELFGDPDGYTPAHIRGVLASRLVGQPFGVLLLDEFEKAHKQVHDRFLQLIDEGSFINGAGECISCRSMIIIATSNTGSRVYRDQPFGFRSDRDMAEKVRRVNELLESCFRFEFLNRFDEIVHFLPLGRADMRMIAQRELTALHERAGLCSNDLTLQVDIDVLDWLAEEGYNPNFGARFLRRTIERQVVTKIAEAIVRDTPKPCSTIHLKVCAGRILVTVAPWDSMDSENGSGTQV